MTDDRLIFIYNADGGIAQGVLDTVHKLLSPATYSCSMCAVTYGALRMHPKWREWLKAAPNPATFYHKDDNPYSDITLPAVLVERSGAAQVIVDATRLNEIKTVDALIAEIERAVAVPGA